MNGSGTRGTMKSRTVSQSQHDSRNRPHTIAPTPKHFNELKGEGKHPRSASTSASMTGATTAMLNMSHARQSSTSPNTARETFLNYFFGGVGPAGQAGPSSHGGIQQKGPAGGARDLLPDLGHRRSQNTGDRLEAGPAYDMKSLGKHLEAVSQTKRPGFFLVLAIVLLTELLAVRSGSRSQSDTTRGDGNDTHPLLDRFLFQYHPPDDPRSRAQGDHASTGQLFSRCRAAATCH